jgi:aspartate ammonia-lyase
MYLEFGRYFLKDNVPMVVGALFDHFFKSFCDEREKNERAFIITHILLLMG